MKKSSPSRSKMTGVTVLTSCPPRTKIYRSTAVVHVDFFFVDCWTAARGTFNNKCHLRWFIACTSRLGFLGRRRRKECCAREQDHRGAECCNDGWEWRRHLRTHHLCLVLHWHYYGHQRFWGETAAPSTANFIIRRRWLVDVLFAFSCCLFVTFPMFFLCCFYNFCVYSNCISMFLGQRTIWSILPPFWSEPNNCVCI